MTFIKYTCPGSKHNKTCGLITCGVIWTSSSSKSPTFFFMAATFGSSCYTLKLLWCSAKRKEECRVAVGLSGAVWCLAWRKKEEGVVVESTVRWCSGLEVGRRCICRGGIWCCMVLDFGIGKDGYEWQKNERMVVFWSFAGKVILWWNFGKEMAMKEGWWVVLSRLEMMVMGCCGTYVTAI